MHGLFVIGTAVLLALVAIGFNVAVTTGAGNGGLSTSLAGPPTVRLSGGSNAPSVPPTGSSSSYPTFYNYVGYLGNNIIYPTVYSNITDLPAESASAVSFQVPGSYDLGYNSTWADNVVTIGTSSPTDQSWYTDSGASGNWQFQLDIWGAAAGASQQYTTGCDTQNFSCSSNAEQEVIVWVPYQAMSVSTQLPYSSTTGGFATSILSTTDGLNMTGGNTNNGNTGGSTSAESYVLDIAVQILGAAVPVIGEILTAQAIANDLQGLFSPDGGYSGNGVTSNFGPVYGSGTAVEWAQTKNGNTLNSSYSCPPPLPAPTINWNYPKPNPCAPVASQAAQQIGQNTFGQSIETQTTAGPFTSQSAAVAVLGSVPSISTITLGVQNNIEVFNPWSQTTFYGSTSVPAASASIIYYVAPAISLSGTVLQASGLSNSPVSGATVNILQSCPSRHGNVYDLFVETANPQGQWHFFGNPGCTFYYSATGWTPFGTVGSPTEVLRLGAAPAGSQYTFPALPLNNYPVTIAANSYTYGTYWSATLQGSSGSQTLGTSTANTLTFYARNGTYTLNVAAPYGEAATPSSFSFTVSGTSITKVTQFSKGYTVSFSESGLLGGYWSWSVTLGGTTVTSGYTPIVFWVTNGAYAYSIALESRYSNSPSSGSVTVAGANQTVLITFTPTGSTFTAKFSESGLPSGISWYVNFNGQTNGATSPASNSFKELQGSYSFTAYPADTVVFCGRIVSDYLPSPSTGTVTGTSTTVVTSITYTYTTYVISGSGLCHLPTGHGGSALSGVSLSLPAQPLVAARNTGRGPGMR